MNALDRDGFAFAPARADAALCDELATALPPPDPRRGGVRNLLEHPRVMAFLRAPIVREIVVPLLGPDACAVNATLFDRVGARPSARRLISITPVARRLDIA